MLKVIFYVVVFFSTGLFNWDHMLFEHERERKCEIEDNHLCEPSLTSWFKLPFTHLFICCLLVNFIHPIKAGVLKLYLLATPIFVFRNLTTLQDALRPSRFKNIAKESLIWELYSQIYSKILNIKVWRPFSGNWRPSKGSRPLVW